MLYDKCIFLNETSPFFSLEKELNFIVSESFNLLSEDEKKNKVEENVKKFLDDTNKYIKKLKTKGLININIGMCLGYITMGINLLNIIFFFTGAAFFSIPFLIIGLISVMIFFISLFVYFISVAKIEKNINLIKESFFKKVYELEKLKSKTNDEKVINEIDRIIKKTKEIHQFIKMKSKKTPLVYPDSVLTDINITVYNTMKASKEDVLNEISNFKKIFYSTLKKYKLHNKYFEIKNLYNNSIDELKEGEVYKGSYIFGYIFPDEINENEYLKFDDDDKKFNNEIDSYKKDLKYHIYLDYGLISNY